MYRITNLGNDYEDIYSSGKAGDGRMYSSRSMGALNHCADGKTDKTVVDGLFRPYTTAQLTNDFTPTVDDEISVEKGDLVTVLYREEDWLYVIKQDQTEGFVPFGYCSFTDAQFTDQNKRSPSSKSQSFSKNRKPQTSSSRNFVRAVSGTLRRSRSKSQEANATLRPTKVDEIDLSNQTRSQPRAIENVSQFLRTLQPHTEDEEKPLAFTKVAQGSFVAAYPFMGCAEDDLSLSPGHILTLLNRDDPDWFWVKNDFTQQEGFVPSSYLLPIDVQLSEPSAASPQQRRRQECEEGSELLVIRDYHSDSASDLQANKGDWVYSKHQIEQAVGGWLWCYCPRNRRHGFIPSSHLKVPLSTVL